MPRTIFDMLDCSSMSFVQLRLDGYQWSPPFTIGTEGVMCICLRNEITSDEMHLRIEVRGGTLSSRYEVILRPNSFSSPYRYDSGNIIFYISFCTFLVSP